MIYISQGHEHSIALEVFFKSVSLLSQDQCKQFTLIANKDHILENINNLNLKILLHDNFIEVNNKKIPVIYVATTDKPASCTTLKKALNSIKSSKDILLTLPTSKNQLPINGHFAAGYTEYLREHFDNQNITMSFRSPKDSIMLMSDHIPLADVSSFLTSDLLLTKLTYTLDGMNKYFEYPDEVIIAGINPHAGEGGILGFEDLRIIEPLKSLYRNYPKIKFYGPLSADTLHITRKPNLKQLFTYMYHDQGLPIFKERNGFLGVNISFGMPFLRMSVDHGTAFELAGKNCADPAGCHYMLSEALHIQARL